MHASKKIKKPVKYVRPFFEFPDLSSEDGNPYIYFQLAKKQLMSSKFYKEANELFSHSKTPYEKHFDIIDKFLNFSIINKTIESEDDDFVYVKIRKQKQIFQLPEFFKTKPEDILKLISNGFDLSIKNIFDRTILHYATLPESINIILQNTPNSFSIFNLDKFESNYLHGHNNFQNFEIILKEMFRHSKDSTEDFLYANNIFGQNPFSEFLKNCSIVFNSDTVSDKDFISYLSIINIIGKFDPEKRLELLNFEKLGILNTLKKNINFEKILEKNIFEFDIQNKKNNNISSKHKI